MPDPSDALCAERCGMELLISTNLRGRIYVECEGEYDYEETVASLKRVFGIVGICPVIHVEDQGFEQLKKDVVDYMDQMYPDKKYNI